MSEWSASDCLGVAYIRFTRVVDPENEWRETTSTNQITGVQSVIVRLVERRARRINQGPIFTGVEAGKGIWVTTHVSHPCKSFEILGFEKTRANCAQASCESDGDPKEARV